MTETIYELDHFRVDLDYGSEDIEKQYKVINKDLDTVDYDCQGHLQALIAAEQFDSAIKTEAYKANMFDMEELFGRGITDGGVEH